MLFSKLYILKTPGGGVKTPRPPSRSAPEITYFHCCRHLPEKGHFLFKLHVKIGLDNFKIRINYETTFLLLLNIHSA